MGRSVKDKFNLPCGQFFMSEKLLPLQQVPIAGAPRRLGPDLVPPFGAAIRDVVPGLVPDVVPPFGAATRSVVQIWYQVW